MIEIMEDNSEILDQNFKKNRIPISSREDFFRISLIIPVFNEEESINLFLDSVIPILESVTSNWEMVFVNDGSVDNTLPLIISKSLDDIRIVVIDFSRNFGKEAALTAGINYATGDVVIPIDVDMQDPPEMIPIMIDEWKKGYDVVLAVRGKRDKDSWLKRTSAILFYKFISKIADINIPQNVGDYRLLDRKVVDVLKLLPERNRFMKGIFAWVGFNSTKISFDRPARKAGITSLGYFKLLKLALSGVISFSSFPLRIWLYISLIVFLSPFCLIFYSMLVGADALGSTKTEFYNIIIYAYLFLTGLQFLAISTLGEYLVRIYDEVKNRPLYVVRKVYKKNH